jgi:hypothetical protein
MTDPTGSRVPNGWGDPSTERHLQVPPRYATGSRAATRFSNGLRYRDGHAEAQTALTPRYVLDPIVMTLGGIELDPCTTPDNPTGAERFYAPPQDGLELPWDAATIYVNPPYGKAREPWVDRCVDAGHAGAVVALLIPSATDTRIFQKALFNSDWCVFLKGRVKFGIPRANGRQIAASHPSALLFWNADPWWTCAGLGAVTKSAA